MLAFQPSTVMPRPLAFVFSGICFHLKARSRSRPWSSTAVEDATANSPARNEPLDKVCSIPADVSSQSKTAIADALCEARERTLALVEPLDDEQLNRVWSPILSPLAWDLGHIANFEELWLVQRIGGREPLRGGCERAWRRRTA